MALPWFREMDRRSSLGIRDCERCKASSGKLARQSLGCGYEPPAPDGLRLALWQPPGGPVGYSGPPLTVCAGYTTRLPQVAEVTLAHVHWSKGNVPMATTDEDLLNSIVILDAACNQVKHWISTPSKDGGGAG